MAGLWIEFSIRKKLFAFVSFILLKCVFFPPYRFQKDTFLSFIRFHKKQTLWCNFGLQKSPKETSYMYSYEMHIKYKIPINISGPRVKSSDRQTKFQRCLVYSDVKQIKIRPGSSLEWAYYGLFCLKCSLFWEKAIFCVFLLGGEKEKSQEIASVS